MAISDNEPALANKTLPEVQNPKYAPQNDATGLQHISSRSLPPDVIQQDEPARPAPTTAPTPGSEKTIVPVQGPETVTPLHLLQEQPDWIDCPFCERRTMTRVTKLDSSLTIVAGILCCLLCVCLACVPCMAGWCQDVDHWCTGCGHRVTHRPHDGMVQVLGPNTQGKVESQYATAELQRPDAVHQEVGKPIPDS